MKDVLLVIRETVLLAHRRHGDAIGRVPHISDDRRYAMDDDPNETRAEGGTGETKGAGRNTLEGHPVTGGSTTLHRASRRGK